MAPRAVFRSLVPKQDIRSRIGYGHAHFHEVQSRFHHLHTIGHQHTSFWISRAFLTLKLVIDKMGSRHYCPAISCKDSVGCWSANALSVFSTQNNSSTVGSDRYISYGLGEGAVFRWRAYGDLQLGGARPLCRYEYPRHKRRGKGPWWASAATSWRLHSCARYGWISLNATSQDPGPLRTFRAAVTNNSQRDTLRTFVAA